MTPEERLAELGIELPEAPAAVGAYVPWARTGALIVTSFQLPWSGGELAYTGKLGAELETEDGYAAARLCALNGVAQLKDAAGELSRIKRIVRVEGHVGCSPEFTEIPPCSTAHPISSTRSSAKRAGIHAPRSATR